MTGENLGDSHDLSGSTRRTFLTGAGAAALAGLAAACSADEAATAVDPAPVTGDDANVGASAAEAAGTTNGDPDGDTEATTTATDTVASPISFAGTHQAGVLLSPTASGLVASFDVVVTNRAALAAVMQTLSAEIERLMSGDALESSDEFLPPIDSGAIGSESTTAGVAITVAVGASLFDDRFGLADLRPSELILMPRFFNDRLVDEARSHGDLSITVSAPDPQAAVFALHQIVRVTDRQLRLRWVQEGYNQLLPESAGTIAHTRNLMGFRDGTSNLDAADADLMNRHVWVQADDAEPEWAAGGTYQAVRVIRMLIEFWATAALVRQEQIFGRHRATGAPLGQTNEGDVPSFVANQSDETIPRRSHMRLANPRTPDAARILRRGFSYLNGVDDNATLDQGLLFLCFQRSLTKGFLEVQARLDGEPLEDYIKPVGGGLYFVLPGPGTSGGWLGETLLS